jgi:carboxylate-amine ligase
MLTGCRRAAGQIDTRTGHAGRMGTNGRRRVPGQVGIRAALRAKLSMSSARQLPSRLPLPRASEHAGLSDRRAGAEPDWSLAPSLCRAFDRDAPPMIGLEEEVLLLRPGSLEPANEVERVLEILGPDTRWEPELRAAQLELITAPAATASDAHRDLAAIRADVVGRLAGEVRIAAVGTHPFFAGPAVVTERPRYLGIVAEWPWVLRRGLMSGLHVHVGVAGRDRALAVYNAARSYLPEIAALSANSPFFEGADSGLASVRLKLSEDLPRSGIPPVFSTWEDLAGFLRWGAGGGAVPDPGHLWWDLRLNPKYGTLEFRISDAQTRLGNAAAIAATCQALVTSLQARYDAGEELPVHDTHRIAENRWRAIRDGVHGRLLDLDTGLPSPTRDRIAHLLTGLEPFSESLGSRNDLLSAWDLLSCTGADEQRARAASLAPYELVGWLADETEAAAGQAPLRGSAAVPSGRLAAVPSL